MHTKPVPVIVIRNILPATGGDRTLVLHMPNCRALDYANGTLELKRFASREALAEEVAHHMSRSYSVHRCQCLGVL